MKLLSTIRYGSAAASRPDSCRPRTTGRTATATVATGCTGSGTPTGRSFVHTGLMTTPTNGRRRPEERSP